MALGNPNYPIKNSGSSLKMILPHRSSTCAFVVLRLASGPPSPLKFSYMCTHLNAPERLIGASLIYTPFIHFRSNSLKKALLVNACVHCTVDFRSWSRHSFYHHILFHALPSYRATVEYVRHLALTGPTHVAFLTRCLSIRKSAR